MRTPLSASDSPLIVTARLDDRAFAFFDRQRRQHFPPKRNHVPAHITLFHALPGDRIGLVRRLLIELTDGQRAIAAQASSVQSIGRGVAYRVEAPALIALHGHLQNEFDPWLTAQDRAPLKPHITIQNKVAASVANELARNLAAEFQPISIMITGLLLWRYLGGPWKRVAEFPFER